MIDETKLVEYSNRFKECRPYTIDEIAMAFPSASRPKLLEALEDLAQAEWLIQRSERVFQGIERRELKEVLKDMFTSDKTLLTLAQIYQVYRVRTKEIDKAIQTLIEEDYLEYCSYRGGCLWLKKIN